VFAGLFERDPMSCAQPSTTRLATFVAAEMHPTTSNCVPWRGVGPSEYGWYRYALKTVIAGGVVREGTRT
jgi:hypothetical protein